MTDYRVATGSNVAFGSMNVIDPQPRSDGIKCTRRSYSADGSITEEGRYIEFDWNVLKDITSYQAILSAFGLSASVKSAAVTVYVKDESQAFLRMNGTAIRPEIGRDFAYNNAHPRNVTMLIRDLSVAS